VGEVHAIQQAASEYGASSVRVLEVFPAQIEVCQ
jgi:hypothetical protein